MAYADNWDISARIQRFDSSADRACAWTLSLLIQRPLTDDRRSAVENAFVAAITHPINEVRWYAVLGIARNLAPKDRALATRCINALALEAASIDTERQLQSSVPGTRAENLAVQAAQTVRESFWAPDRIPPNAYNTLDVEQWFGAEATAQILTILLEDPENSLTLPGFIRASRSLVDGWDEDDQSRPQSRRRERNRDSEQVISKRIQDIVMRVDYEFAKAIIEPIIGAVDNHPREVHWVLQGLTETEDHSPNTSHYWRLWELFADAVKRATWASSRSLDSEHPFGSEMLSAVFLTSWWKDSVRHWRSLEGHDDKIHALFEALPGSWIIFDSYIRFLYHIGERSLPQAFVRIANWLANANAHEILTDSNTVFMLVVLLQRHVYGKATGLKRDPKIRNAVLLLLDTLVEAGSPAAFRMRDDFVTPIAG